MCRSSLACAFALMIASSAQGQGAARPLIEALDNTVRIARGSREVRLMVGAASMGSENARLATRLAKALQQEAGIGGGIIEEMGSSSSRMIHLSELSAEQLVGIARVRQGRVASTSPARKGGQDAGGASDLLRPSRMKIDPEATGMTIGGDPLRSRPSGSVSDDIDEMARYWARNIGTMRALFKTEIIRFSRRHELQATRLKVVGITPRQDGMLLDFGNGSQQVVPSRLSPTRDRSFDMTELAKVSPFSNSEPGAIILSESPYHNGEFDAIIDAFCFEVCREFPDLPIYRDPLSDDTIRRGKHLNEFIATTQNTIVLVAERSLFKVKDYRLIPNIRVELQNCGIVIKDVDQYPLAPWIAPGPRAVIVVNGHSSEELAFFVDSCGEAGYFEGNLVIFNSCETALTKELIRRINGEYKAIATLGYEGKVNVADLEDFLLDLANQLKADSGETLEHMLRKLLNGRILNGTWNVRGGWHVFLPKRQRITGDLCYA